MPVSGIDESSPNVVRLGDAELAWIEAGPLEEDAGDERPPLILVHGFTGHRDDWIEVLPDLAKHRRTIAIDLRGHGDSKAISEEPDYSFEQLVRDVLALLDHLGIDRCDLLGHSVGGMIAQRFALAHPDRIRRLILMNTAPEVPEALSEEAGRKAAEIAKAKGMATLQELSEKVGRRNVDPILAKWGERYWLHQRRRLGAMTPESYAGIGHSLFSSESLVQHLGDIDIPTLVLVGEFDHEFLPGADLLERHLPQMERVTLADSGHHPHQENRSDWLNAIEDFLSGGAA